MVSFPPESGNPESRAPESTNTHASGEERLAPVTFLHEARRAERMREAEAPAGRDAGMREHPSVRHHVANVDQSTASAEGKRASAENAGKRASNVSLNQLARRGMSRWELEQVLEKREIDPCTAQAEVDRLESVGLLDDEALAANLVYTQHTRKGLGRSAIEQELKRRHIDPLIIEEALEEIAADDELERATELAMKRIGQLASYDDETAKRRLHGFLARKGYDSSTVRHAMDAALATRGKRGVRFR
ncbi:MAG TPA: regulatory protein RecX [Leifsonia sp.]|nr:regulatory protein RecX [Leifsonia sp.]